MEMAAVRRHLGAPYAELGPRRETLTDHGSITQGNLPGRATGGRVVAEREPF